jgi:hypothetical protein
MFTHSGVFGQDTLFLFAAMGGVATPIESVSNDLDARAEAGVLAKYTPVYLARTPASALASRSFDTDSMGVATPPIAAKRLPSQHFDIFNHFNLLQRIIISSPS